MDKYHLGKYIHKATTHLDDSQQAAKEFIYGAINERDFDGKTSDALSYRLCLLFYCAMCSKFRNKGKQVILMHIWKHFSTITRHRHKVIVHCFMAGIFWQGLRHDLSKYSPAEFIPGAKNYLGDKSPNEKERERYGFSRAWLHHQGRNKHHFEYWVDYNPKLNRKDAREDGEI